MLESNIPKYTILSHAREDQEVTFKGFPHKEIRSRRKGFIKIEKLCELARQEGLQYAWANTCCIDKTRSSELIEAINSMFHFYIHADVCYAWLLRFRAGHQPVLQYANPSGIPWQGQSVELGCYIRSPTSRTLVV
ncbi:hypothetical protein V8C42DRAFT_332716 [Trichoderma barbatum]